MTAISMGGGVHLFFQVENYSAAFFYDFDFLRSSLQKHRREEEEDKTTEEGGTEIDQTHRNEAKQRKQKTFWHRD